MAVEARIETLLHLFPSISSKRIGELELSGRLSHFILPRFRHFLPFYVVGYDTDSQLDNRQRSVTIIPNTRTSNFKFEEKL